MKAWKTLLTAGLGILVAGACTVTVSDGEGDGFSDDDLELDDQQGFDEDDFFADDSEPTDTAGTEDPGQTDTAETGVADDMGTDMSQTDEPMATDDAGMPAPDDMMTDDMPTDDAGMPAPDDMMTDDTEPMCEVEVSPDDQCEQCMAQDCTTAFTACGCDPDCQLELDAMRACFADKNFEEMPPATQAEVDEWGTSPAMARSWAISRLAWVRPTWAPTNPLGASRETGPARSCATASTRWKSWSRASASAPTSGKAAHWRPSFCLFPRLPQLAPAGAK